MKIKTKNYNIIYVFFTLLVIFIILIYLAELDRNFSSVWSINDFYDPYVGGGLLGVYNTIIRYYSSYNDKIYNKPIILDTNSIFPKNNILKNNYKIIKEEAINVYNNYNLPSMKEVDKIFTNISLKDKWKVFILKWYDEPLQNNCKMICPKTCNLINQIPEIRCAMFSVLDPYTSIPSHRGPFTGCLRYHLGLSIPKDRSNCYIKVTDKYYHWKEGDDIIFDDTYSHEVFNNTNEIRIILFIDIVRPLNGLIGIINNKLTSNGKFAKFSKNINDKGEKLVKLK